MSTTSTQQNPYQTLVVDDDSMIRANLKEYLLHYHQADYTMEIDEAPTAQDALEQLKGKAYDLIICDINLPDNDGFYVLQHALEIQPKIKRSLITAYDLDAYLDMAKQHKVYNIIAKTAPFNFQELSTVVNNLLVPEKVFGLHNYLAPDTAIIDIEIQSSPDISTSERKLNAFFTDTNMPELESFTIALIEAMTNALYHSYKGDDGNDRYKKGDVVDKLDPSEYITIAYGHDNDKVGVSIKDQGGTITGDDVLYWIERNISGDSLLDTHGRGVFLMHRLTDRLIINIERGKRTELIMLRYFENDFSDNKPIYINEM